MPWWLSQGAVVAVECPEKRLFGLQYHPEVQHSDRGTPTLRHFLKVIARLKADWKIEKVLDEELAKIRALVCPRIQHCCTPASTFCSRGCLCPVMSVWTGAVTSLYSPRFYASSVLTACLGLFSISYPNYFFVRPAEAVMC